MENQPSFQKYEQQDEIDLRDYINVLLKRKWSVLAILLIAMVAAAMISLIMPQTFEAMTLVKLGQIKSQAGLVNLESIDDIKTIFYRGTILEAIITNLNLPSTTLRASVSKIFSIEQVEKTSFLKIKGRGPTSEKAVEISNIVTNLLLERHNKIFAEAKKTFEIELENIVKNKEKTGKDIEKIKGDTIRLNTDIKKYEQEINKRADIQSEGQGRIAESYINLLAAVKNQKEAKEAQILDLEQQLNSLDQSLQQKEYERTYQIKPTSLEVPTFPPETRISPNRKQNVMVAGVLGLFIGILWAFAAEYWQKNKNKI